MTNAGEGHAFQTLIVPTQNESLLRDVVFRSVVWLEPSVRRVFQRSDEIRWTSSIFPLGRSVVSFEIVTMFVAPSDYRVRPLRPFFGLGWMLPILGGVIAVLSWLVWLSSQTIPDISLQPIAPQTVSEGETISIQVATRWKLSHSLTLEYRILSGPTSAAIDAETGQWSWTPGEHDGGRSFHIEVEARTIQGPLQKSRAAFDITVNEHHRPPQITPIPEQFVASGQTVDIILNAEDLDSPISPLEFRLGKSAPIDGTLDPRTGRFRWTPHSHDGPSEVPIPFSVSKLVATGRLTTLGVVVINVQNPEHVTAEEEIGPKQGEVRPPVTPVVNRPEAPGYQADFLTALGKLSDAGKLLTPSGYPAVRRLFAERFSKRYAAELSSVFTGKDRSLETWLDQHADFRDELYTAFGPDDDVVAGMKLIERLHSQSLQRLGAYPELAIAIAVTWDRESAVYDYTPQQRRSHAAAPSEKLCDAIGNFEYYSDPATPAERRVQKLPWEFLAHVVNHRTPLKERLWVWRNYADKQIQIGRCYGDVAYDHQMIQSGEVTSHLATKEYTLSNLKAYGGICVVQADYAARVSKCLGIPAAYVEGRARSGGNHAWVMWTELKSSNDHGIAFALESHGRFFLDRYYVGALLEPQSGHMLTDRELELRLEAVGLNPLAYRQARLIMQAWPELKLQIAPTASQELDFLEGVTQLNPGCQPAWQAIARFARSQSSETAMRTRLDGLRDRCFKTFRNCPDFLCMIIDDLLAYEPELTRRIPQYDSLMQLWANTGRRDLVCRLRLLLTDQMLNAGQAESALTGLAQTIKRFPDEGREIPRLLDKYERVARNIPDGQKKTLKLYQELLPLIPRRRQGQPSPFYREMLGRASQRFQQAGESKAAQAYTDQLKKLQQ